MKYNKILNWFDIPSPNSYSYLKWNKRKVSRYWMSLMLLDICNKERKARVSNL